MSSSENSNSHDHFTSIGGGDKHVLSSSASCRPAVSFSFPSRILHTSPKPSPLDLDGRKLLSDTSRSKQSSLSSISTTPNRVSSIETSGYPIRGFDRASSASLTASSSTISLSSGPLGDRNLFSRDRQRSLSPDNQPSHQARSSSRDRNLENGHPRRSDVPHDLNTRNLYPHGSQWHTVDQGNIDRRNGKVLALKNQEEHELERQRPTRRMGSESCEHTSNSQLAGTSKSHYVQDNDRLSSSTERQPLKRPRSATLERAPSPISMHSSKRVISTSVVTDTLQRAPQSQVYTPDSFHQPPCIFRRPGVGNFLVIDDPTADGQSNRRAVKRFDGILNNVEVRVSDPRLKIPREVRERGRGYMKQRLSGMQVIEFEWDENSPGSKPPPPPTAVLLTGLNPLTTFDQITKFLRPFGRIKDVDVKMDTKSGMQLGICWVKFDGPLPGRPGTAHDVAVQVVKMCDGQRVGLNGDERVRVVLDGRGIRAAKAVQEEMYRRYKPKQEVKPTAPNSSNSAEISDKIATQKHSANISEPERYKAVPNIPARPLPTAVSSVINPKARPPLRYPSKFDSLGRNFMPFNSSIPIRPNPPTSRAYSSIQDLSRAFHSSPISRRGDLYSPRRSRSKSSSTYSSSDSDDDRLTYRQRMPHSPPQYRRDTKVPTRHSMNQREVNEAAVEKMRKALAENGHAYVFIDAKSLPHGQVQDDHVYDHFRAFKPDRVMHNLVGWYVLFPDDQGAYRAQRVLDKTAVLGHRISLLVMAPTQLQSSHKEITDDTTEKGGWRFLTITKKRPTTQHKAHDKTNIAGNRRRKSYASYTSSDDGKIGSQLSVTKQAPYDSSSDESVDDHRATNDVQVIPQIDHQSTNVVKDHPESVLLRNNESDTVVEAEVKSPSPDKHNKRLTQTVGINASKRKKARHEVAAMDFSDERRATVFDVISPNKSNTLDTMQVAPKIKKIQNAPLHQLITMKTILDDEDAYWLSQAMDTTRDVAEPLISTNESLLEDSHPLFHTSGAWRAEGWKKILPTQKSAYLPQRNRAAAGAEEAAALTTGRTARVTGRRLALDMETHRKTASSLVSTAESDLFAFNQLRIRKKQLRFARSAIEGYGLYAMETIQTGEMVCEYVGELCRSAVAEIREQRYLRQGIGSSYLFRIDGDVVCDATFTGSVSRLINHSCDPSASAKIISINGLSKIVIYAKRTLNPGEEILYDYKFPLESDPALRVPCLCGAASCRGWLN